MIPKKIHIAWKHKNFLEAPFNIVKYGAKQLKDLNPTWSFEISDDNDIEVYLQDNLSSSDYNLLKHRHIVEKTDVWRLLKIINEGGLYMDIDRYCDQSLDNLLTNEIECVLPTFKDIDFSQDIMLSCPQHEIHKAALSLNLARRREGCTDVLSLAPITYFHAATKVLLGISINRYPTIEQFKELRNIIDSDPGLITYREEPPFDTFIYRGIPLQDDKSIFYRYSNVIHWPFVPNNITGKPYGE